MVKEKLELLYKKCDLDMNGNEVINASVLKKIKVNQSKNQCLFHIYAPSAWSLNDYQELIGALKNKYEEFDRVELLIETDSNDISNVKDYFDDMINLVTDHKNTYQVFLNRELGIDDQTLVVNIYNKAEKNKFDLITGDLEEMYRKIGFNNLNIKTYFEEKKQSLPKKYASSSNSSKKDEVPTDSNIILGLPIKKSATPIREVIKEVKDITVMATIFAIDFFESPKSNYKIITLKVTDGTDSIYAKVFTTKADLLNRLKNDLKVGGTYLINGRVTNDKYSGELTISVNNINKGDSATSREDNAKEKRVELHAHTKMSQMDGLISAKDLIKQANDFGHEAIAITDHNGVQSFPEAYFASFKSDAKVIYGVELNMIDDNVDLILRGNDSELSDITYIIFDTETTGFNPGAGDQMIEIGAVKVKNGEVIDTFSELIDPGVKLKPKITEITGITDDMLKGQASEEEIFKKFVEFIGDSVLVAHNAMFDMGFIDMASSKYKIDQLTNPVIDTLELSRKLYPQHTRHSLSVLVKRFDVEFDEDSHHRALYDAEATAKIFAEMLRELDRRSIYTLTGINQLVDETEIHKSMNVYHVTLIAKTNEGLKNLFKLVSYANTKYLHRTPRILKSVINEHREGILVGSSCYLGEVFREAARKSDEELRDIMQFYDYIEIQPPPVYNHLIQMGDFNNEEELFYNINKIIRVAGLAMKDVVATGDVHHLNPEDKIFREVIINQRVPGGGLHPLNKKKITEVPSYHFRTTEEMLADFEFLGKEKAREVVITNPLKIAKQTEKLQILKDKLYAPVFEGANEEIEKKTYQRAYEVYGKKLPEIVEERLKFELKSLIDNNYSTIYLTCEQIVKSSNDKGYMVGSRGTVGSSLVATMLGISEVNPLPPHYICSKCQTSIFEEDGQDFTAYLSGYDLPKRKCKCGTYFTREGNDLLFAMFLGFYADKIPDIDLNFSSVIQAEIHNEIRDLFGAERAFRAGTIGTVAAKTAYGFAKGYAEDNDLVLRSAEIERLAKGCEGVKRTTGQHPGGIVVLSKDTEIYDFTPYQYPADDARSDWYTTCFDYKVMEDNILKFDVLGKDDPTVLKMMADTTGVDPETIPFDDQKVYSIYSSPDALGVTEDQILCPTGTMGIPEFGTDFVINVLGDTKPKNFANLVKVTGLTHGFGIWLGNAKSLIDNNILPLSDVIGCRDEIMIYLIGKGMEKKLAFDIMEMVRKGKHHHPANKEKFAEYKKVMAEHNVPDWYINSCEKITYMFPQAHAVAYVMQGLRVGWYKVYEPLAYYAAQFSIKHTDFEIETMINGYDAIRARVEYLREQGFNLNKKEKDVLGVLENALEMTARGFSFLNIDLDKSDSHHFVIEGNGLIPPFRAIEGLGEIVANNIIKERAIKPFVSIDDLAKRCKISSTTIDKMRSMGIFEGMPESGQLSLFDI